ncbi:MAG TPA: metallophosphoesterase, partial [Minicystis sp.]|nr:metallophosphoesterase [Minicystis sp.]
MVDKGVRLIAPASALLVALAAPAVARAATFEKGPYLQGLGPTHVTVKFELDADAPASVSVVDRATHKAITAEDKDARRFHALRVTGLAPATAYDYTVTAGDAKSELGRFTTAPVDARPFRFIVYGDSRSDEAAHRAIVRAILERNADFLLNTGDLVYRGSDPEEWSRFFRAEEPLLRDRCAFVCVGNHELVGGRDGEVAFLKYFAPDEGDDATGPHHLHGTFRWGNTRFFLLNAMDQWGDAEKGWLADALGSAASEAGVAHRIAVLHHGPFSSGPHHGNPRLGTVVRMLREGHVELVLAGHDHIYERGEGAGLKYVISGG